MKIRTSMVCFSPDEGSGGFNYDSLVAPVEGSDMPDHDAGVGGQPPASQSAPVAGNVPDLDKDESLWDKILQHPRLLEAFNRRVAERDGQWRQTVESIGLKDEMFKRYEALRQNNPYWTKQQAMSVAAQQTQQAHGGQGQPGEPNPLEKKLAAIENFLMKRSEAERMQEKQAAEKQLQNDILSGIRESKTGPADDETFQDVMRVNMLNLARRDLDAKKPLRPWTEYAKEAHARIARIGGTLTRGPSQTVIPPTGVAPGTTKQDWLKSKEEELTRQLVIND